MVVAIIIAAVILLLCIASYFLANIFANIVVHPNVHSYDESRDSVLNHHCSIDPLTVLENHKVEEFKYKSEFGYELFGRIIRANADVSFPDGRRRVVILCHGWTSNHITMLTYGKLYQELGFDIVAYDHRFHGNSERNTYCTMGLLESRDLIGLANFVRKSFPENAIWGVQGESMGSATAMQAAPELPWLSFIVEDCGFSSMRGQMAATLDNKKLPHFPILNIGNLILKTRYHFSMDEVNAMKALEKTDTPMLFCQGGADTFVPARMIHEVYGAKKDKKEIHVFEGSEHAESIWDHTDEYRQVLKDFLKKYEII